MIAVGFVAKTGSAVAVALRLEPEPELLDRRTITLAPEGVERFVYHAAANLARGAPAYVADSTKKIERNTRSEVGALLRSLGKVNGAAIVGNTLEMPGSLEQILAAHPKLHSAEGVLYRSVIADALTASGVMPTLVPAGDLTGLAWVLDALGKVPSPWRKEHKDAAMAAAAVLESARAGLTGGRAGARGSAPRTGRATSPRPKK